MLNRSSWAWPAKVLSRGSPHHRASTRHYRFSSNLRLSERGVLRDFYESEFASLAKKYGTAYVLDVLDGLLGHTEFMADSIHPNDVGYQIISDRVYLVLRDLL